MLGHLPSSCCGAPSRGTPVERGLIQLEGCVAAGEFLGEFICYTVKSGAANVASAQAHYTGARSFAPGEAVALAIQPQQIRVLAR